MSKTATRTNEKRSLEYRQTTNDLGILFLLVTRQRSPPSNCRTPNPLPEHWAPGRCSMITELCASSLSTVVRQTLKEGHLTPETDDDIFGRQFVKRVVSRPLLAGNHSAMDTVFHDETTFKDNIPLAHRIRMSIPVQKKTSLTQDPAAGYRETSRP